MKKDLDFTRIHRFVFDDLHIMLDVNSGSVHVTDQAVDAFLDAGFPPCILSRNWRKPHIDLPAVCSIQLEREGVPLKQIRTAGIDTYADSRRFFSARRLGIRSGRIFTGIVLREM